VTAVEGSTRATLLLVHHESLNRAVLARRLLAQDFTVEVCDDAVAALALSAARRFDLIVCEWTLAGLSGLDLLTELRHRGERAGFMMLAPKTPVDAGVRALNDGADDFVPRTCPFEELLARARAVLRRTTGHPNPMLTCVDLVLDPVRRKVARAGSEIRLSAREFMLLQFLMSHAGRPQSRRVIIEAVWEKERGAASNVVDVYIRHLRNKVDVPFGRSLIHTVRRYGYVLSERS
jgi:DNA-binding response OmpR family regulator